MPERLTDARIEREKPGLQWVHWIVVIGSLVVTLAGWRFSQHSIRERSQLAFDREVARVEGLLTERMQKYEIALLSGVAKIEAQGGTIELSDWRRFARRLDLGKLYPGVMGIGVIRYIPPTELESFLAEQRRERPDFRIHPPHDVGEYWPITFIEPEAANDRAVGLDMAHESNRYRAARKARDTGSAQITGPIVLVQDEEQTPGFLFFVPYYDPAIDAQGAHTESFRGLVYAPFIARNLIQGTLGREARSIRIEIHDGESLVYAEPDDRSDEAPGFVARSEIQLYGRTWNITSLSTAEFHSANRSSQPLMILSGGVLVDAALLWLFLFLSRSKTRAEKLALEMSAGYREKAQELEGTVEELERSNSELEHFATLASHDLQEPMRTIRSYIDLLKSRHGAELAPPLDQYFGVIESSASRMSSLIHGLLQYSQLGDVSVKRSVELTQLAHAVQNDIAQEIRESGAEVEIAPLPTVDAAEAEVRHLLRGLMSNAVKFRRDGVTPVVRVGWREGSDPAVITVSDNGIGIEPQYHDRVFQMFRRLHSTKEYPGTGIGLTACRKIIELHDGKIWIESSGEGGTTVSFTLESEA